LERETVADQGPQFEAFVPHRLILKVN
jgi:hypothetical protein